MTARPKLLKTFLPLLAIAGAVPLHAQMSVKGCPTGFAGNQLDGYTAGTPGTLQTCLTGQFVIGQSYNVQLVSAFAQFTVPSASASALGILINVPASFAAGLANPAGDPVTVTASALSTSLSGQFQVNPPLTPGGPVFVGGVSNSISATLFQGGTAPFFNGLGGSSNVPPGMDPFPQITPNWTGFPSAAGTYLFNITAVDGWGNSIHPNLAFYIVPVPVPGGLSVNSAPAEGPAVNLTITGSGFVAATTVLSVAQPATVVTWTPSGGLPVTLASSGVTAGQINATIPANLLISTGYADIAVVNPAHTTTSSTQMFSVYPTVTGINPSTRTVGAGPFPMDITGTGFRSDSVIYLGASPTPLIPAFIDKNHLRVSLPNFTTPQTVNVLVFNSDETASPAAPANLLTVAPSPILNSITPLSANQGATGTTLTANGAFVVSGLTIYFNGTPLTTTVVNSGQLSATIPASLLQSPGTVPVWVQTSDGYQTASRNFPIVYSGPPVQLTPFSPLPGGVLNAPYSFSVTASGGLAPYTFTLSGGALPAGLALTSDGLLSGTPKAAGTSTFALQVIDAGRISASRDYRLTILATPLMLTTPPLPNVPLNQALQFQFAATGGVAPYTFVEFGDLPPGTQMVPSGLLGGTPTKVGTYSFRVFANDSEGSSTSLVYSLLVAPAGVLITPPSPLPSGQIGVPFSTQMTVTGGTGPYTWTATGLPPGLSMAASTGIISGTPQQTGTFTLSVSAKDSTGAGATQSYTLVIATGNLTITTASLPNGAIGSSYSATVQTAGSSGAVTFTATGLPGGVSLTPAGALSGTPSAAGTYTIAVTATDAQGQKATATFTITIAGKLVVTPATISNAVLGTPISAVTLAVTGGTAPYQWQSASLPAGLSLSAAGVLSGTPSVQGSFSSTVFVVDANGALASGTVQIVVGLPGAPAVNITGLAATNSPASQPRIQIGLASPYPVSVTVKLTLTFVPDAGADDPAVQFSGGGRTAQVAIPSGSTGALTDLGLQTGTVAGTINVTAQVLAGATDITPSPAPVKSTRVSPGPPVIVSVSATRTAGGITVVVNGYATTRAVATATYVFTGNGTTTIATGQLDTQVGAPFTTWYQSAASTPFGSQFSLTQPFTVSGNAPGIQSVTVTLTNGLGTSQAVAAIVQ